MSSSCFALSLDFPDEHMSGSTEGLGIPQESQAVHELMAMTVQEAAKSGCAAGKAQSLLDSFAVLWTSRTATQGGVQALLTS